MNLAVIPARGGSKRVPRKNISDFCGKPMLAWAITAAKRSRVFDRIIVSTDDAETAEVAKKWGAETPFMRPSNLADDLTPTVPVIAHAVETCRDQGWIANCACCIYPCAPFIRVDDLVSALNLMIARNAPFVYPVAEYAHPVQRALSMLPGGQMQFINPECELVRTQDLEKRYHDAAQFYWGTASAWTGLEKMHSAGLGMPIPNWRVIDIDSADDWRRAELMFKSLSSQLID